MDFDSSELNLSPMQDLRGVLKDVWFVAEYSDGLTAEINAEVLDVNYGSLDVNTFGSHSVDFRYSECGHNASCTVNVLVKADSTSGSENQTGNENLPGGNGDGTTVGTSWDGTGNGTQGGNGSTAIVKAEGTDGDSLGSPAKYVYFGEWPQSAASDVAETALVSDGTAGGMFDVDGLKRLHISMTLNGASVRPFA